MKRFFCIGFISLLTLVSLASESVADIFSWEYHNCTQKCAPKEKCCKETCGYKACIKQNTTRETAIGAELTDPGAADTAMAVCYPHLDVMKKCSEESQKEEKAGLAELAKVRDEYCALIVARARSYASKEECVSQMTASEKKGKLSAADILKVYKAGITRLSRE